MSDLPILTESRQKCARRCQREHHLSYDLGIRPVTDEEALRLGGMVHAGLEVRWLGGDLVAALNAMKPLAATPFEYAKAYAMLAGYVTRWEQDFELYDVLAVERRFEAPLVNPATGYPSKTWQLGGKLDAVVREKTTGRVLLVEHKTASADLGPGSDYFKRLRIDGQISTYYAGARVMGFDVCGALYDVLRKPQLRPFKATALEDRKINKDGSLRKGTRTEDESPQEFQERLINAIADDPNSYYGRAEVVRLEAEMEEAAFDTWQLAKQLHEAKAANRFPRNPDACVRFGNTCPYFPACTGEASLDDPNLYRQSSTVHPELEVAA